HASLCNIIERIFGVLKWRFRILLLPPEYSLDIQARVPAALAATHNFIHTHDADADDEEDALTESGDDFSYGHFNEDDTSTFAYDNEEVDGQWDQISQEMWDDYRRECEERGINADEPVASEDKDDLADDLY
ncbi:hypothetical protein BYT27DRAFT_7108281, partial [Phlegmacium glaucopus]